MDAKYRSIAERSSFAVVYVFSVTRLAPFVRFSGGSARRGSVPSPAPSRRVRYGSPRAFARHSPRQKEKSRTRVSGVRLFVPGYHLRAKQKADNTPQQRFVIGSGSKAQAQCSRSWSFCSFCKTSGSSSAALNQAAGSASVCRRSGKRSGLPPSLTVYHSLFSNASVLSSFSSF